MKTIVLFISLISFALVAYAGKPLSGVSVQIEEIKSGEVVASQQTNKNGEVAYSKLGKGVYKVVIVLPKQRGKYEVKRGKNSNSNIIAFHSEKKILLLKEATGCFVVKFSKLKNLVNSTITPTNDLAKDKNYQQRYAVGKFEIKGKQGGGTIRLDALTVKEFTKMLENLKDDPKLMLIN